MCTLSSGSAAQIEYLKLFMRTGNLIKYLPVVMGNISPLIGVVLSVTGEQSNDGGVFSKYSYIEEQSQFITYPYGYVALDLSADFSVRKECFTDIEIQELSC